MQDQVLQLLHNDLLWLSAYQIPILVSNEILLNSD